MASTSSQECELVSLYLNISIKKRKTPHVRPNVLFLKFIFYTTFNDQQLYIHHL